MDTPPLRLLAWLSRNIAHLFPHTVHKWNMRMLIMGRGVVLRWCRRWTRRRRRVVASNLLRKLWRMRFQDIYLLKLLSFKIVSVKVHQFQRDHLHYPSLTRELQVLHENNADGWCTLFVCVSLAVIGNNKKTYILYPPPRRPYTAIILQEGEYKKTMNEKLGTYLAQGRGGEPGNKTIIAEIILHWVCNDVVVV